LTGSEGGLPEREICERDATVRCVSGSIPDLRCA
jgi:hypothetical protein